MQKSTQRHISPLKEIEEKIEAAYLHYIVAKGRHLNIGQELIGHFTSPSGNTKTIIK